MKISGSTHDGPLVQMFFLGLKFTVNSISYRTFIIKPVQTIRKTYRCNEYPFKPHFYIVKLGYAGVYNVHIFLTFGPKHKLWVLVRTASPRWF